MSATTPRDWPRQVGFLEVSLDIALTALVDTDPISALKNYRAAVDYGTMQGPGWCVRRALVKAGYDPDLVSGS